MNPITKTLQLAFVIALSNSILNAQKINFDKDATGKTPTRWNEGITGIGNYKWRVAKDSSAPSAPNVLLQSAYGSFPWCVLQSANIQDGTISVKFKPISGRIDSSGGLIWRFKNKDEYYVARANALENNVALYYVKDGYRNTIKYVDAKVPSGVYSTLKVEFKNSQIKVFLNGKKYIDLKDTHISHSGKVGLWTKADSTTMFDDFEYSNYK